QRRVFLAGAATAFAASACITPARAAPRATRILLTDAFLLLDSYLALKPAARDRFVLAYRAVRNGKPTSDVTARIIHHDKTSTPVAIDAAGWVTELPTLDQLKGREMFEVDGPSFDMALELRATLTPAARLPTSELIATLSQVNAAIVEFAEGNA